MYPCFKEFETLSNLSVFFPYRTRTLKELLEENLGLSISSKKTLVVTYNVIKENIYNNMIFLSMNFKTQFPKLLLMDFLLPDLIIKIMKK